MSHLLRKPTIKNRTVVIVVASCVILLVLLPGCGGSGSSGSSSDSADTRLTAFCKLQHEDAIDVDQKCQEWLDGIKKNYDDVYSKCKQSHDEKYPGDIYNCLVVNGGETGWNSLQWTNKYALRTLTGEAGVQDLVFSPDGKLLASGASNKTVKLWDVTSGSELRTLTWNSVSERAGFPLSIFSPDGKLLASALDTTITVWDVASGTEVRTLTGHAGTVMSIVFSPDGATLTSGSYDGTVRLWDVTTGSELRSFPWNDISEQTNMIYFAAMAFSPDGTLLATSLENKPIELWDVASGSEVRALPVGDMSLRVSVANALAFAPDGKTLASSFEKTIKLWDVASGTERYTLTGHTDIVRSLVFSPDGKTLASGADDGAVGLWDVTNGKLVHVLTLFTRLHVGGVAFSPDGKLLASGSGGFLVQLWTLP